MNDRGLSRPRWMEALGPTMEAEELFRRMVEIQAIVFEAFQRMTREFAFDLLFSEPERDAAAEPVAGKAPHAGSAFPGDFAFLHAAPVLTTLLKQLYARVENQLAAMDRSWYRQVPPPDPSHRKRKGPYRRLANIKQ